MKNTKNLLFVVIGLLVIAIVGGTFALNSINQKDPNPVIINTPTPTDEPESPLILKNQINKDAVLWITLEGCEIDNPVFQGDTNEEYLRIDENGEGNIWGSYFLDYINVIENGAFTDKVNIIYGHSYLDVVEDKKFSKLKRYKDKDFAKENPTIDLEFLEGDSQWEIFAATDVPITIDYIDPNPDDKKYQATLDYMLDNSYVDFGVDVTTDDQILVLSTCTSNEDVRFTIAAKLVK